MQFLFDYYYYYFWGGGGGGGGGAIYDRCLGGQKTLSMVIDGYELFCCSQLRQVLATHRNHFLQNSMNNYTSFPPDKED